MSAHCRIISMIQLGAQDATMGPQISGAALLIPPLQLLPLVLFILILWQQVFCGHWPHAYIYVFLPYRHHTLSHMRIVCLRPILKPCLTCACRSATHIQALTHMCLQACLTYWSCHAHSNNRSSTALSWWKGKQTCGQCSGQPAQQ